MNSIEIIRLEQREKDGEVEIFTHTLFDNNIHCGHWLRKSEILNFNDLKNTMSEDDAMKQIMALHYEDAKARHLQSLAAASEPHTIEDDLMN